MKGEFYKMYYENWDEGTECLTLEQEGAFLRLCNLMYRRQVSVMVPHMPVLAGIWRCRPEKAKRLLRDLVGAQKIGQDTSTGTISNERVARELEARGIQSAAKAKAGHKGGVASGQTRSMRGACDEHTESMRGVCDPHTESMRPACDQYASNIQGVYETHDPSMNGACEAQEPPKPLKNNNPDEASASPVSKQNEAIRVEKSREEENREEKRSKKGKWVRSQGSRLPPDWQPTLDQIAYCKQQGYPDTAVAMMAQDFVDYWVAKTGPNATKMDWSRTWQRWCRNQFDKPGNRVQGPSGTNRKQDRFDVNNPHNVCAAADRLIANFDAFFAPGQHQPGTLAIGNRSGHIDVPLLSGGAGESRGHIRGSNGRGPQ